MPIPDPLRSVLYESGGLVQACPDCDWAQRGHKAEMSRCPACGAALGAPVAIAFGGMTVIYDGRNFDLYTRSGGMISIERNDLPEILQFMCRHADDIRTGKLIHDAGHARRIPKHKHFTVTAGVSKT